MFKEVLHDMEGMFNLGPDAGFGVFKLRNQPAQLRSFQKFAFARFHGNVPFNFAPLAFLALLNPLEAAIAKGSCLSPVQQGLRLRHIADVAGGADDGMHQSRVGIKADVGHLCGPPYVRIVVASIESPPGAVTKDGNGKVLREVQR